MAVEQKNFRGTVRVLDYKDLSYKENRVKKYIQDIKEIDRDFAFLFHNLIFDDGQRGEIIDAMYEEFNHLVGDSLQLILHLENDRCNEVVRQLNHQVNNKLTIESMLITYIEPVTHG